ncbi:uncharacterized protein LOC129610052 [Condylostylus longicornis]|uniref:uncharacterized protein LOC129610052 n=1 Tax=Condylostylus longicornis TaxID=2530218 RepID=UPI00244E0001|nr:uncharacterized protein LOC129610052 [Condylostylus longicornis]
MDSFAKYGRKNNNNNIHYKNKKKSYKNNNDLKNIYNGKVDLNENKFHNGDNKIHTERTFGRRTPPTKDPFNTHSNDRLLMHPNQNINVKMQNLNIAKNTETFSDNNVGIKSGDMTDRLTNESIRNSISKKYSNFKQNANIKDNFEKQFNVKDINIPAQNDIKLKNLDSNEIDILNADSKIICNEPELDVYNEEKNIDHENEIRHPLCCSWTFWHTISGNSFRDCLNDIKEFDTVEEFWSLVNHMIPPTQFYVGSDFSLFKSGIKPEWEDKRNEKGGAILITIKNEYETDITNMLWRDTLLSLIDGQTYGANFEHICGAVISIRPKLQRIALWVANGKDNVTNADIQKRFLSYLKEHSLYNPRIVVSFKQHET